MANDHDISVLNTLITTTIDSADGYERSAQNIDSDQLKNFFIEMAQERRQIVGQLQQHVRQHGATPSDDGSLLGAAHRGFEDLRNAVTGGKNDEGVIAEVERGESYLKDKYDTALNDSALSPDCRQVVQQAYDSVQRGAERARSLKHGFAGTS